MHSDIVEKSGPFPATRIGHLSDFEVNAFIVHCVPPEFSSSGKYHFFPIIDKGLNGGGLRAR
jgi:hypothetical protein